VNLVRRLDEVFSMYIRLRDSRALGFRYFKCISCGKIKPFEMMDCGHYFSRTHMATRFSEDNAHGECSYCNRFCADHLVGYHDNLVKKIGQERYNRLVWQHNEAKHWTDFELEEMIKRYKLEIKRLKGEKQP
jgi:hypothetical protein